MKTVSVVIPTYNRLNRLQRVLKAFEEQTYPAKDFEVVVVSDGSTDGTNEYLQSFRPAFSFLPVVQENQGPAAARNRGVEMATGNYVLFVDDDVIPEKNLIHEHMRYHEMHKDSVVIGPMVTPDDFDMLPWVLWEQSMLEKQYRAMEQGDWLPTARQFYTGNASLLRSYLIDSGGFDPTILRAEDVELAYRLANMGLGFVFNSDAVGFHYAERGFNSWLQIPYSYGRNDIMFAREKQQTWLLPAIFSEHQGRNLFVKSLCALCLDHQLLTNLSIRSLTLIAKAADVVKAAFVPRKAYSGIFNLRYYQGVADELGGRKQFYRGLGEFQKGS
jgi:GT2 family glycosyltransferase